MYFQKTIRFVKWTEMKGVFMRSVSRGLAMTSWAELQIVLSDDKELILGVNEKIFHGLTEKLDNAEVKQKLIEITPEHWRIKGGK